MVKLDLKRSIIRTAIHRIAQDQGILPGRWCTITDESIWNWILDNKKDNVVNHQELPRLRMCMPMVYQFLRVQKHQKKK